MGESNWTVVVEQPFDWVGSVGVPVAAVLVSSLIAIWIARAERRANERGHVRQAAVGVVKELSALTTIAKEGTSAEINAQHSVVAAELNAFAAVLARRQLVVPKYIALVLSKGMRTNDRERLRSTSAYVSGLLDDWLRGEAKTRRFRRAMPVDDLKEWIDANDPSEWADVVSGKKKI